MSEENLEEAKKAAGERYHDSLEELHRIHPLSKEEVDSLRKASSSEIQDKMAEIKFDRVLEHTTGVRGTRTQDIENFGSTALDHLVKRVNEKTEGEERYPNTLLETGIALNNAVRHDSASDTVDGFQIITEEQHGKLKEDLESALSNEEFLKKLNLDVPTENKEVFWEEVGKDYQSLLPQLSQKNLKPEVKGKEILEKVLEGNDVSKKKIDELLELPVDEDSRIQDKVDSMLKGELDTVSVEGKLWGTEDWDEFLGLEENKEELIQSIDRKLSDLEKEGRETGKSSREIAREKSDRLNKSVGSVQDWIFMKRDRDFDNMLKKNHEKIYEALDSKGRTELLSDSVERLDFEEEEEI